MKGKKLALYTCIVAAVSMLAAYSLAYMTSAFKFGFVPGMGRYGDAAEVSSKLSQIEALIDEYYYKDPDKSKMTDYALIGAVASLGDPYSSYFTDEDYAAFNEQVSGHYFGIGVTVSMDSEDGAILVVSTHDGTPAAEAGLEAGDKIIAIEGESIPSDLDVAVSKIKGEEGTFVNITVLKKDTGSTVDMDIERKDITLVTMTSEIIEGDIGYIKLSSFDQSVEEGFQQELEKVKNMGAKSIILDLRGNPGGTVVAAQAVGDALLPECDITYMEYKSGKREYIRSEESCYDGDIVVLVDGGSASASEIVSGALRDNDRAEIVGTQTFGKGLVQSVFNLDGGGYVKLTIARYFTPAGDDINEKGITPDYVVEPSDDPSVDLQLEKAVELLHGN